MLMAYCLIVLAIPTIIGSILLYLGQKKLLHKLEEISILKNKNEKVVISPSLTK